MLERFGETVVHQILDMSIRRWYSIIDGHMKGEEANRIRSAIGSFTPEQLELFRLLVPKICLTSLFQLMVLLDESEDVAMIVRGDAGSEVNVKDISDGLAGELWSDAGWVEKYSKFNDILRE